MLEHADVESLASIACALDFLKNKFLEPEWHRRLERAVNDIHAVARAADGEWHMGIYAAEDA